MNISILYDYCYSGNGQGFLGTFSLKKLSGHSNYTLGYLDSGIKCGLSAHAPDQSM